MTEPLLTFKQGLRLTWRQFLIFTSVGILFTFWSWYYGLSFPAALDGIMLSAKLGLGSILVATMAFYYRTFWEDIAKLKKIARASATVRYHSSGLTLLFGATLAVFFAILADLTILLLGPASLLRPVSLGSFMTGILLLLAFVVFFFGRSLAEMQTIKDVSKMNGASLVTETQVLDSLDALARQLEEELIRDKARVTQNESVLARVKKAQEALPRETPPLT